MTESLTVSIVIPTWRRAPWLERCLEGVLSQSRRANEIVVVGRPEDEDARSVVDAHGLPVRWVDVDRPGHVAPVRRGIHAATGEVVAFLDDDVVPQADWLTAIVEPFKDRSVACVGGRVMTPGLLPRNFARAGQIRWYGRYVGNVAAVEAPHSFDVASVMEGNWAWRRTMLEHLHFDPRLDFDDASMYGLDLTLQARKRGRRIVYQPTAVVVNASAPRDPALDRRDRVARTYSYSRNYSLIASRHFQGLRRFVFWAWWLLVGERASYGVATGTFDLMRRRAEAAVIVASFKGKFAGWRLWRADCQ